MKVATIDARTTPPNVMTRNNRQACIRISLKFIFPVHTNYASRIKPNGRIGTTFWLLSGMKAEDILSSAFLIS